MIGILGGTFFGLMFGLASGLAGLIYAFVFNILAPLTGGLKVRLDTAPAPLQTSPNPEPPSSSDP